MMMLVSVYLISSFLLGCGFATIGLELYYLHALEIKGRKALPYRCVLFASLFYLLTSALREPKFAIPVLMVFAVALAKMNKAREAEKPTFARPQRVIEAGAIFAVLGLSASLFLTTYLYPVVATALDLREITVRALIVSVALFTATLGWRVIPKRWSPKIKSWALGCLVGGAVAMSNFGILVWTEYFRPSTPRIVYASFSDQGLDYTIQQSYGFQFEQYFWNQTLGENGRQWEDGIFINLPSASGSYRTVMTADGLLLESRDGTSSRNLGHSYSQDWSPTDDVLAYGDKGTLRVGDITGELFSVPSAGSHCWSPSGDTIYYAKQSDGKVQVWAQELTATTEPEMLFEAERLVLENASPDGRFLLFHQSAEESEDFYVFDLSHKTQIAIPSPTEGSWASAIWGNDSEGLLLTRKDQSSFWNATTGELKPYEQLQNLPNDGSPKKLLNHFFCTDYEGNQIWHTDSLHSQWQSIPLNGRVTRIEQDGSTAIILGEDSVYVYDLSNQELVRTYSHTELMPSGGYHLLPQILRAYWR